MMTNGPHMKGSSKTIIVMVSAIVGVGVCVCAPVAEAAAPHDDDERVDASIMMRYPNAHIVPEGNSYIVSVRLTVCPYSLPPPLKTISVCIAVNGSFGRMVHTAYKVMLPRYSRTEVAYPLQAAAS